MFTLQTKFQTTFTQGGRSKILWKERKKALKTLSQLRPRIRPLWKESVCGRSQYRKKFFLSCLCVFYFLATPLSPQMFRLCAFQSGTFNRTVSSHTYIPDFEPSSIGCHVLGIYLRILLLSFIYRLSRALHLSTYTAFEPSSIGCQHVLCIYLRILLLSLHLSAVTCSASICVYCFWAFIYRLSRALHLSAYTAFEPSSIGCHVVGIYLRIPAFEPSSIGCHVLCIYLRILLLSLHLSAVTCSASIYV